MNSSLKQYKQLQHKYIDDELSLLISIKTIILRWDKTWPILKQYEYEYEVWYTYTSLKYFIFFCQNEIRPQQNITINLQICYTHWLARTHDQKVLHTAWNRPFVLTDPPDLQAKWVNGNNLIFLMLTWEAWVLVVRASVNYLLVSWTSLKIRLARILG